MSRDLGEVGNPVEEPGSNISTQVELNKRQEQELARLKEESPRRLRRESSEGFIGMRKEQLFARRQSTYRKRLEARRTWQRDASARCSASAFGSALATRSRCAARNSSQSCISEGVGPSA